MSTALSILAGGATVGLALAAGGLYRIASAIDRLAAAVTEQEERHR